MIEYRYVTSDITLHKIAQLIRFHSGIYFSSMNLKILDQRIQEYLKKYNLKEKEFHSRLILQQEFLFQFIGYITTNHTHFFRSIEQFHALGDYILPFFLKQNEHLKHIDIWSCACSTGEEPYSLAMYIYHFLSIRNLLPQWTFTVYATDIDNESLKLAQNAVYSLDTIKYIPQEYRQYIQSHDTIDKEAPYNGSYFGVHEKIKNSVQFASHNLMDILYARTFDLIFCRNVFIYFNQETQEKTLSKLTNNLKNNGFFFLSPTESILGFDTCLQRINQQKTIYYQKNDNNLIEGN